MLTVGGAEASGGRQHGDGGAGEGLQGAQVVHVGVDVRVRRVERRLGSHGGVPLRRDADEGDVREGRTARQRRRPAGGRDKNWSSFQINWLFFFVLK